MNKKANTDYPMGSKQVSNKHQNMPLNVCFFASQKLIQHQTLAIDEWSLFS
jgi:hypothetical protein